MTAPADTAAAASFGDAGTHDAGGPAHAALDAILAELDPESAASVRACLAVRTVPTGTAIIEEGARDDTLYAIGRGRVAICRAGAEAGREQVLATLEPGAIIGEMALLDRKPRSASARALDDTVLLALDPAVLRARPNGAQALGALRGGLATLVTERIRSQNDKYVASVERELAAVRERQHFGRFFIYMLVMMTLGMVANDLLSKHFVQVDIFSPAFAWVYLLIIMVPTAVVIRRMRIPLHELGITTRGLWRSVREGCVLSVGLMAIAMGAAWALRTTGIHDGTPVPPELWATTGYFFHSALQELIARGLLQSSFQRFLDDKRGLQSVVLSSTLFGVFHLHFGLAAVVVTILSGLLFGAIFLRHRNLAGVTIVHFFAGAAAFWSGLI